MRKTKLLLIGASLLASTGLALADDQADPNEPPPAGGEAPPPATGTPAPAAAPAPAPGGWLQLNDRPLVIPQGKFEVHGGLPILSIKTVDPTTMMSTTDTLEALSLGATYGVADKIEAGIDYAFPLHPNGDITKGILGFHGAFAALHDDKMDLAVAAGLALNVGGNNTLADLQLGGWFRYKVTPMISLFTGQPPVPFTLGGFSSFIAPPVGYQLQIGLNNNQPTILTLPVGVGIQAAPQVFLFAETNIADIYLSNAPPNQSALVIFSDFIPLGVGGYYSVNDQLDLGVTFADDLKSAGDFYVFTLAARYYIK
ncbi:MAG: hypothetical protein ACM31C_34550 [Acidobacteriota bacterium]